MKTLFLDLWAMIRDIDAEYPRLGYWGMALNAPQFLGGIFFIFYIEGALVLIANLVTLVIASQIHKREPFSRLTSICHVIWLPLLPFLIGSLVQLDGLSAFSIWLTYVVVTMIVCLVMDTYNLSLYFLNGPKDFRP